MNKIPVAGPWITQREIDYVTDAVSHSWYGNANLYHEKLEAAFAKYVGRKYAVALPSCTSGLHLALLALGVKAGDEVIVPDLTWIASSAPISYVGATPRFVDVDIDSWCISSDAIEENISDKCRAIIAVDLYGNMPDMQRLQEISDEYNIPIIEDAAEAIGSEFSGKKAGKFGNVSVFSLHGSKTLTASEGGMLVTDDESVYQRVRFLMDHGRTPTDVTFNNEEVAYKYKMSSMQAALALAQLERIDELVAKKKELFKWYQEGLGEAPDLTLNQQLPNRSSSYWMTTIIVDEERQIEKDALIEDLAKVGIDSRPMFRPLSSLRAYSHLKNSRVAARHNKNTYKLSPYGVNLPSALILEEDQVKSVCDALLQILEN